MLAVFSPLGHHICTCIYCVYVPKERTANSGLAFLQIFHLENPTDIQINGAKFRPITKFMDMPYNGAIRSSNKEHPSTLTGIWL